MAKTCVTINIINMGVSERTDSFTPLKFKRIRKQTPIRAKGSLYGCNPAGK
jgi:hypothetical protein